MVHDVMNIVEIHYYHVVLHVVFCSACQKAAVAILRPKNTQNVQVLTEQTRRILSVDDDVWFNSPQSAVEPHSAPCSPCNIVPCLPPLQANKIQSATHACMHAWLHDSFSNLHRFQLSPHCCIVALSKRLDPSELGVKKTQLIAQDCTVLYSTVAMVHLLTRCLEAGPLPSCLNPCSRDK